MPSGIRQCRHVIHEQGLNTKQEARIAWCLLNMPLHAPNMQPPNITSLVWKACKETIDGGNPGTINTSIFCKIVWGGISFFFVTSFDRLFYFLNAHLKVRNSCNYRFYFKSLFCSMSICLQFSLSSSLITFVFPHLPVSICSAYVGNSRFTIVPH